MKTIFTSFFLTLIAITSFAQTEQNSTGHLTFKGVPIDGTLNEYVAKMIQSGFTHIGTEAKTAMLNGDFAGYKDCYIGVSTLTQKDLVHKIAVIFPEKDTWSTLSGNYFNLKNMLTQKYDKPSEVVEKFDGYSQPSDDNDKMYRVKLDNCKYYSIWQTDKGEIQLSIEHESVVSCYVLLAYFDKTNSEIIKAKAIEDL